MTNKITELEICDYCDRTDRDAVLVLDNCTAEEGWDDLELDGCEKTKTIKGYIARVGPTVVGFIFVFVSGPDVNPLSRILRIAVADRSRRRGVGAALIEKAKQTLDHNKKAARLIIDVDSDDVRAGEKNGFLSFLDKMGFRVTSGGSCGDSVEFDYSLCYTLPGGNVFKNRIKYFLKK